MAPTHSPPTALLPSHGRLDSMGAVGIPSSVALRRHVPALRAVELSASLSGAQRRRASASPRNKNTIFPPPYVVAGTVPGMAPPRRAVGDAHPQPEIAGL